MKAAAPPPAANWRNPAARTVGGVKAAVFLLALWPFARLVWLAVQGGLGANPVEFVTRSTGWWTLFMLCATLAVTPLWRLLQWPWLLRLRRMLGLFAFFYAALHFTTYLWWDQAFEWAAIGKDIVKRPFITVGFAAFVLLVPLAATSFNAAVRRLGGRRWQALHRAVYAIVCLGALHFWWMKAGKQLFFEPALFSITIALLLGYRLWMRKA